MELIGCTIKGMIFRQDEWTRRLWWSKITHSDIQHTLVTGVTHHLGLGADNHPPRELLSLLLKLTPLQIIGQRLVLRSELTIAHYSLNGDGLNDFAVFAVRLIPTRGQLDTYGLTSSEPQAMKSAQFYQRPDPTLVIEVNNSFRLVLLCAKPKSKLLPLNLPAGPNWQAH